MYTNNGEKTPRSTSVVLLMVTTAVLSVCFLPSTRVPSPSKATCPPERPVTASNN
eukprot:gene20271-7301_t